MKDCFDPALSSTSCSWQQHLWQQQRQRCSRRHVVSLSSSSSSWGAPILVRLTVVAVSSLALACVFLGPATASSSRQLLQTITGTHLRILQQQQQQLEPFRFLQEESTTTTTTNDTTCDKTCCDALWDEECVAPEANPFAVIPFGVQILFIVILITLSAVFSGLTLGLLGLDKTGLEIIMQGDDKVNAEYAKRIYPLRKRGNLLLCTLVLGNVAVNAFLSILMADKAGGLVGFLASTFLIVIFGEILPQAICSRNPLWIGSTCVPLVRIILVLFFPIAGPLGWMLDKMLGKELATTYSREEMIQLLQIHVEENAMDADTATAMKGALNYKNMKVQQVMTPIANTFMLSVDDKLNFETIAKIFKSGYSRIPVYEIDKNNIIGLLFVKDLIFVDPSCNTRVADFVELFGRAAHVCWVDDKLGDVLRELKKGRSHMALVRDVNNQDDTGNDPFYELVGIVTLEDIIEEILGEEIIDETDTFVGGGESVKVDRGEDGTFRWERLCLLDSKIVDQMLSFDEARAVAAHLQKNYSEMVSLLTERQLQKLVAETPVQMLLAADQQVGQILPDDLLYAKGVASDCCTLVLSGKVTVVSGADKFRSDVSSWGLLAAGALTDSNYAPDFSAFISNSPCRCIRISRTRFSAAVDASAAEKRSHHDSGIVNNIALAPASWFGFGTATPARATADTPSRCISLLVGSANNSEVEVAVGRPADSSTAKPPSATTNTPSASTPALSEEIETSISSGGASTTVTSINPEEKKE